MTPTNSPAVPGPSTRSRIRRHALRADWVDRHERGCDAWTKARMLRGRLTGIERIACDRERRWRWVIAVVSPKGLRRRVLLDNDRLAELCQRLLDHRVAVRAYREDGVWELDGDIAAQIRDGAAICVDGGGVRSRAAGSHRRVLH